MLEPRPYQTEAVQACLEAAATGQRRVLVALPTGTGKTIVFAKLLHERGGRSLVLAHRDELIQQAADKLHLVDDTLRIGIVKADRDETTAPTVVASVQTLARPQRLRTADARFYHAGGRRSAPRRRRTPISAFSTTAAPGRTRPAPRGGHRHTGARR